MSHFIVKIKEDKESNLLRELKECCSIIDTFTSIVNVYDGMFYYKKVQCSENNILQMLKWGILAICSSIVLDSEH